MVFDVYIFYPFIFLKEFPQPSTQAEKGGSFYTASLLRRRGRIHGPGCPYPRRAPIRSERTIQRHGRQLGHASRSRQRQCATRLVRLPRRVPSLITSSQETAKAPGTARAAVSSPPEPQGVWRRRRPPSPHPPTSPGAPRPRPPAPRPSRLPCSRGISSSSTRAPLAARSASGAARLAAGRRRPGRAPQVFASWSHPASQVCVRGFCCSCRMCL